MRYFLVILFLVLMPAIVSTETIQKYSFPLQEPIYVGKKILCTAWYSYQRPDMGGAEYRGGNYPAREGSIVRSCFGGQVIACGQMSGDRYAGWKITILQDDGVTVEYCHVSNQWVLPPRLGIKGEQLPGSRVEIRQPIATVGRTGRTSGSHLRIVFYRGGQKIFFSANTFGLKYDDFEYHRGSALNDLRFDVL